MRTETDSFGPIEVLADRYWGAQTERSRQNFRIGIDLEPWIEFDQQRRLATVGQLCRGRQASSQATVPVPLCALLSVTSNIMRVSRRLRYDPM